MQYNNFGNSELENEVTVPRITNGRVENLTRERIAVEKEIAGRFHREAELFGKKSFDELYQLNLYCQGVISGLFFNGVRSEDQTQQNAMRLNLTSRSRQIIGSRLNRIEAKRRNVNNANNLNNGNENRSNCLIF